MDFNNLSDGFFAINEVNGFMPIKDPLERLPDEFEKLQNIMDNFNQIVLSEIQMTDCIANLPNYLNLIKKNKDIFVLQALFRSYAFLTSGYLLQPAHLNQQNGKYGKARTELPSNITQPFEYVAEKLQVYPYMDYHYGYSLGNYIRCDKTKGFEYENLKMACSFSKSSDENGFIMLHVDIVSKTPKLIRGIKIYTEGNKLEGLQLIHEASIDINSRRQQMWKASNYKNYNNFRAFLMGIKGNEEIFGNGVIYQGSENIELRTYRGQTGAQDDVIPTLDIFTGVVKYYPDNELTKYLLNLREYRPKIVQKFFQELEKFMIKKEDLTEEEKMFL